MLVPLSCFGMSGSTAAMGQRGVLAVSRSREARRHVGARPVDIITAAATVAIVVSMSIGRCGLFIDTLYKNLTGLWRFVAFSANWPVRHRTMSWLSNDTSRNSHLNKTIPNSSPQAAERGQITGGCRIRTLDAQIITFVLIRLEAVSMHPCKQ